MKVYRHALVLALLIGSMTWMSNAITEDMDQISMRDASATKDRPRLDDYDMD